MTAIFIKLMRDKRAATAVEYGLLVGVLTLSLIFGMKGVTNQLYVLYNSVHKNTENAMERRN